MRRKGQLWSVSILVMLLMLAFGSVKALAAQSRLICTADPTGSVQVKPYVYQRGVKTYLRQTTNQQNTYDIEIPDTGSMSLTVSK